MSETLRWGIISAGEISNDFVAAFHAYLSPNNHTIKGVAARNSAKAEEFCKIHGISHVYKNYEDLLKDPAIGKINEFFFNLFNIFCPFSQMSSILVLFIQNT